MLFLRWTPGTHIILLTLQNRTTMFMQKLLQEFSDSFFYIWTGFASFVPYLLAAIVVFIIGWIIASIVSGWVRQLIDAIKLNKLLESAGAGQAIQKSGMRLDASLFIAEVVKWFIVLVFLMVSLQLLNLNDVASFLGVKVLSYIGDVLIAILILIIGFILAGGVKKFIIITSHAMNVRSANFLGSLARYAIIVFAFAIALPKILALDPSTFVNLLANFVTPLVWGIALALGLAFGLGGRDVASRTIEKFTKEMSGK